MSDSNIDFTFLYRLNEGDKVRVNCARLGEIILERDKRLVEYNQPEKYYFHSFHLPGGEAERRQRYGIFI